MIGKIIPNENKIITHQLIISYFGMFICGFFGVLGFWYPTIVLNINFIKLKFSDFGQ